jgi:ribosome-associated protein
MDDLIINDTITIPAHELEISASRAGGPGGQHVNKTSTKITLRWNAFKTSALDEESKVLVLQNLQSQLTTEGDLLVHNSESRSQEHNKKLALAKLADKIRKALIVPKVRKKPKISRAAKESRLQQKSRRSEIKKMRSTKFME